MTHERGLAIVVIGEEQPCSVCGEPLPVGEWAFWRRIEEEKRHEAWHCACDKRRAG